MAFSIVRKPLVGKYGKCWTEGRVVTVDKIVYHHTASGGSGALGGAQNVWNYWYGLKPGSRVSSHYIIGKDGSIIEAVAPTDTAWHAGTNLWNNRSIGIEIVNWGNGTDPFPDVQLQALAWLTVRLLARFSAIDLGLVRVVDGHTQMGDIVEHSAILPGKIDMRGNFPWSRVRRYIVEKPWTKTVAAKPLEPAKTVTLPVPTVKPTWWSAMMRWLRLHKKRRP